MDRIPVPSHIHYELLLQLLERQTLPALREAGKKPHLAHLDKSARNQIQTAMIMVRKAMALQKQFEEACAYQGMEISYRWSLNESDSNLLPETFNGDLPDRKHDPANNLSDDQSPQNY